MNEVDRYLLDTTVLIDALRGQQAELDFLEALRDDGHEVGVCAVNVAELFSGLLRAERTSAEDLLSTLQFWDLTADIAVRAGISRYDYARQGQAIATTDALIAATAAILGATVVTSNVKHFPMPELRIVPPSA